MEPMSVVPWAQTDKTDTSQTAGSAVATGGATSSDVAGADDDDGGVVASKFLMRLSFNIVAFFFARRIWRPCVNLL